MTFELTVDSTPVLAILVVMHIYSSIRLNRTPPSRIVGQLFNIQVDK